MSEYQDVFNEPHTYHHHNDTAEKALLASSSSDDDMHRVKHTVSIAKNLAKGPSTPWTAAQLKSLPKKRAMPEADEYGVEHTAAIARGPAKTRAPEEIAALNIIHDRMKRSRSTMEGGSRRRRRRQSKRKSSTQKRRRK
jgi:hypothetical protein